jgi:SPX domain protein involved in polyphosphate accumulation
LLDKKSYEALVCRLEEHMQRDKYFESDIISLYYDTPDYRLIRTSLEKPVFKEKIRLRSYGVPSADSTVFLEIKRKFKGVVYKRRSVMPLKDAEDFCAGYAIPPHNPQIENELRYAFDYYPELSPRMFVSYHRLAYSGKSDKNLRVTFDDRIVYRSYDLEAEKGIYGEELLERGQRIMEIKIPGAMPLWLSHLLDELKIYPSSYSKYGNAYLRQLKNNSLGVAPGITA